MKVLGEDVTPKQAGIAAVIVGGGGFLLWRYKNNQAAAAAAVAPVSTDTTDSTDQIDPNTGIPYSEEDSATDYGAAYSPYGGIDPTTGIPYVDEVNGMVTSNTSGTGITTNQEWATQAEQEIENTFGYTSAIATSAVGKYLGQSQSLSTQEATAIQSVTAEIGQPPTGGPYRILTSTSTGGTGTTSTTFTTAPRSLSRVFLNKNGVELKWAAVSQNGVTASSYRLQTFKRGSTTPVSDFTTSNTIGNVGGLAAGTSYTTHVWAVPAQNGKYASISYTTPKK